MTTLRPGAVAMALAIALAAGCSGDDAPTDSANTSERPTTTAAPPTPEEAFLAGIEDHLSFGVGSDAEGAEQALATGQSVCDVFDTMDDPTLSTSEADALAAVGMGPVIDGIGQDDVAAVVLALTAEHLCPEHAAPIGRAAMAARGVQLAEV